MRKRMPREAMGGFRRLWLTSLVLLALTPALAAAQTAPSGPSPASPASATPATAPPATEPPAPGALVPGTAPVTLPTVEVVGTTPLPGTGIDRDKVPANVQSLSANDLQREGSPSLVNTLVDRAGSVSSNATIVDPFQP